MPPLKRSQFPPPIRQLDAAKSSLQHLSDQERLITAKVLPPDDPVRNGLMLPVRMRRGDIVLFTRATVHSSAPNTSPTTRVGYGLQYFREDVRWLDPRGAQDPGSSWDPAGEWRPLSDDSCPAKQVTPVKQLGETNPGLAAGSVNVSAPKKAKE